MYLDDKGLVLEARCEAQHAHVGRLVDEVLNSMEDSTTSGGDPAVDATLADGLARHTRMGIDVLQKQKHKRMQSLGYDGLAKYTMTWHHIYGNSAKRRNRFKEANKIHTLQGCNN